MYQRDALVLRGDGSSGGWWAEILPAEIRNLGRE